MRISNVSKQNMSDIKNNTIKESMKADWEAYLEEEALLKETRGKSLKEKYKEFAWWFDMEEAHFRGIKRQVEGIIDELNNCNLEAAVRSCFTMLIELKKHTSILYTGYLQKELKDIRKDEDVDPICTMNKNRE